MEVKYAVIPCAGHGTRFLPITKGVPKEMCPIVDKPTLDYIVEECLDAGITDIVLIVSEGKDDIKKYYDLDPEYEEELRKNGKGQYADLIHKIATKAKFHYVTQYELLGLGHAVLQAKLAILRQIRSIKAVLNEQEGNEFGVRPEFFLMQGRRNRKDALFLQGVIYDKDKHED